MMKKIYPPTSNSFDLLCTSGFHWGSELRAWVPSTHVIGLSLPPFGRHTGHMGGETNRRQSQFPCPRAAWNPAVRALRVLNVQGTVDSLVGLQNPADTSSFAPAIGTLEAGGDFGKGPQSE